VCVAYRTGVQPIDPPSFIKKLLLLLPSRAPDRGCSSCGIGMDDLSQLNKGSCPLPFTSTLHDRATLPYSLCQPLCPPPCLCVCQPLSLSASVCLSASLSVSLCLSAICQPKDRATLRIWQLCKLHQQHAGSGSREACS